MYLSRRIRFSGGLTAIFRFNKCIYAHGNSPDFLFLGLEVYSHNGLHWHHRVFKKKTNSNRKQASKPVSLKFCSWTLVGLCCHVIWGSGWFTVQCINTAKTRKFPKGRAKVVGDRNIFMKPKNCRSAFWKKKTTYSLRVICEVWQFSSILKKSVVKGKWNCW